jgi:hypothetical protein
MCCAESDVAHSSTIVGCDAQNQEEEAEEEEDEEKYNDDGALFGDEQSRPVGGFFRHPFIVEQDAQAVKPRSPAILRITDSFASTNPGRHSVRDVVGVGPPGSWSGPNAPIGMPNLNHICYFNACIQCLLHLEPLRSYVRGSKFRDDLDFPSRLQPTAVTKTYRLLQDLIDENIPILKDELE